MGLTPTVTSVSASTPTALDFTDATEFFATQNVLTADNITWTLSKTGLWLAGFQTELAVAPVVDSTVSEAYMQLNGSGAKYGYGASASSEIVYIVPGTIRS
jgi:hypothetical protein